MLVKYLRNKLKPYTRLEEFDPLFDENSSSMVSIEPHVNYNEDRDSDEEIDNGWDEKEMAIIRLLVFLVVMCVLVVIKANSDHQLTEIDYLFIIGSFAVVFSICIIFLAPRSHYQEFPLTSRLV